MKKAMLIVLMGIFTTFVMAQDKKEAKPATKKEPAKTETTKPAAPSAKAEATTPAGQTEKKASPAHNPKTEKKAETVKK